MLERTRARRDVLQQKMQDNSVVNPQRKRRPLLSQNSEEQLVSKTKGGEADLLTEVVLESPNKRTRTDWDEKSAENVPVQNDESGESHLVRQNSKPKSSSHVNQRMQKILNQRKVWEAEEKGQDISFDCDNIPSPIRHEPEAPEPRQTQSLEHQGRKRRLAALAARVKGWEDDISQHDPPKTPETDKAASTIGGKPPTGRVQQGVQAVPVEKSVPQHATLPGSKKAARVVRSEGEELTMDSLSKFAVVGKSTPSGKNGASSSHKSLIQIGNNSKTVLQTKQQVIVVNSSREAVDSQLTPNSRTFQQRVGDLQRNGCNAQVIAMNSSSATAFMEQARAERQKELEQLRNRKVHGMNIHQKGDENIVGTSKTENQESNIVDQQQMAVEEDEKVDIANQDESLTESEIELELHKKKGEEQGQNQDADESFPSVSVQPQDEKIEDSMQYDEKDECESSVAMETEEEDTEEEGSYSDSLLEDTNADTSEKDVSDSRKLFYLSTPESCAGESILSEGNCTGIESKLAAVSVSDEKSEKEEQEEEACQMIDDLFEGVLSEDDSPPRSHSPLTMPNLTRVKSKKEIRTELTVRNQTCNEAEDTHTLTQPSKFQRTCLSKSNSTESIVSLCQEKDFPIYTISSYRTEKRKSISKRPDKRVVRNEAAAAKAATLKRSTPDAASVKEVISDMMYQVSMQQRVIQQTSAALNCCYDAQHGKGTITEVEAEKLLLIASERRLALLADIQRMKQKRSSKPESSFKPCQGKIVVGSLRLPMRTEYIFSISNRRDTGELRNHYYFVLVRNGHRMFSTQLVSTLDDLSGDSLVFKDQFVVDNLSSDFQITLEVYSLNHRTRADGVPVQDKPKGKLTGILQKGRQVEMKRKLADAIEKTKSTVKKATSKSSCSYTLVQQTTSDNDARQSLTPRKLRSSKRTSHMPMMSPGGPNAIRISNFSLIGSTSINLNVIMSKKFTLQKVPFLSPISGQLLCSFSSNFQSEIERRGFLTMFDDVGGLGAWHRRWCALRQGKLYSWTYPDDEQHKKPLMTLALRECISREIRTVERILCARPNTFELRTMRPRRQGDKQNLISQDTGSVITTKHWLSADTKDERVAWIECLNQALVDVRAWDMEALKPFK